MTTKRFKELKNLSKDELAAKIRELEANLFQARMKKATGQLENTATLWQLRKSMARAKTLQTQMERASLVTGAAPRNTSGAQVDTQPETQKV